MTILYKAHNACHHEKKRDGKKRHLSIPGKSNKNDLEASTLGLHFVVNSQHFINGRLKVKCIARIHDVYQQSNERFIEEERPRVTSLASSNHNHHNIGLSYNNYNPDDNDIDKDTYLDNIKGDASSLNAGSMQTCHSSLVVLTISTSLILFNYLFKFNYALTRLDSS
ncbi:hypothetical protein PVAND_004437 [Polypedilum vanderplanki]|uniref:Uncharacterized protein n=1 Tax=Polypedilum vanderplanki TaxID=319348 RepID=A0A9J6BX53_POLVA|nr:hypothetical protein PVAND_004437 [Polypedilum vanderplanki]